MMMFTMAGMSSGVTLPEPSASAFVTLKLADGEAFSQIRYNSLAAAYIGGIDVFDLRLAANDDLPEVDGGSRYDVLTGRDVLNGRNSTDAVSCLGFHGHHGRQTQECHKCGKHPFCCYF